MNSRSSPSSPFSPTRPSRLILHQCSLSEAQTQLRLSPGRLRLYASETDNDAQRSGPNETDKYRASSDTYNTPHKEPYFSDLNEHPGPPDTPSPVSSHADRFWSDLDSWQDRGNVASETTSNSKPDYLKSDCGPNYDCHSLSSIPEVWKPPKPRKPSFLAAFGSTVFDTTPTPSENAQYTPTHTTPGTDQQNSGLPRGYIQSSPSSLHRVSKTRLNVNRATRKVIWRPSLRLAPYRAPVETYQLPVHDPERPFPMPIPTMDKLPLRWESMEKYRSMDGQEKDRSVKRGENSKKRALIWTERALVTFSLDEFEHSARLSQSSSLLRVGFRLSVTPLNLTNYPTRERRAVSQAPVDDAVNLLRLTFAVPVLLLRAFSSIAAATRYPKVLLTMIRFITALVFLLAITTLWIIDKLRSTTASRLKTSQKTH